MTLSYFQSYELHRKQFPPGSIWEDRSMHTVKKLQIIKKNEIPSGQRVYKLYQGNLNITFKILDSLCSDPYDMLSTGKYVNWSANYMTTNYKPLTNE